MTHSPLSLSSEERLAVERYLQTLGTLPQLTAEEECALSARALAGDAEAVEQLTQANLPFVVTIARQYAGQGMAMQDLINEGNIGLMNAARQYDAHRGKRFVQYAVWKVRHAIERALQQQDPMRAASLDAPLWNGAHTTLHDVVGNGDANTWQAEKDDVKEHLALLDERQRKVATLYYGLDGQRLTYQEIAQQMHLKRERARQILKKALRKIRQQYATQQ